MGKHFNSAFALCLALAVGVAFTTTPVEARESHRSHSTQHAKHSKKRHASKHKSRRHYSKRSSSRSASVSGSGTGCLPSALRARLTQVAQKFGHVEVISTYRAGATTPGGKASYHASCRAVDFNPPSGKYSQVASWLKSNHNGGVGTYSCGMHHIHIDSGPAYRFHSCQSASSGEEMTSEQLKAAQADWPSKPGQGVWPLVIHTAKTDSSKL